MCRFFKRMESISESESVLREIQWPGGNLKCWKGFHAPLDNRNCPRKLDTPLPETLVDLFVGA